MSIINATSNILDKTARALNEIAFGDIRGIFNYNSIRNFTLRPIGLYNKSYDFMINHLQRNIGNGIFSYDGFGIPIGELANPFYNSIYETPWFYMDKYKNMTSDYIEYVKTVYGYSLSTENINDKNVISINDVTLSGSVGVDTSYLSSALKGDYNVEVAYINPNHLTTDTTLGVIGSSYVVESLKSAMKFNDTRKSNNFSITSSLKDTFGMRTNSVTKNDVINISSKKSSNSGRYDSPFTSTDLTSPVYVSNYGHWKEIGNYVSYYNSLSDKAKEFFRKNALNGNNRTYYPGIYNNGSGTTSSKDYLTEIGFKIIPIELNKKFNNYNRMDANDADFNDINTAINTEINASNSKQIRGDIVRNYNHSHTNIANADTVYVYAENRDNDTQIIGSFNSGTRFGSYMSYANGLTANDLLKKTNDAFKYRNYDTLIGRFHESLVSTTTRDGTRDTTQTAVSEHGISHGRNLLAKTKSESQGYTNPYCRVWTYHHQYKSFKDTIRPFSSQNRTLLKDVLKKGEQKNRELLESNGVLNYSTNLVNISPKSKISSAKNIKSCMFSIENLAWKDNYTYNGQLSSEQVGPFGGRIMWFPPYDIHFSEQVSANWNETSFIGRGESIYTYANTSRDGSLKFKLLVDHPSLLNHWSNRGKSTSNSVNDVDDPEQQLLRFFAGCDVLTNTPYSKKPVKTVVKSDTEPSPDTEIIKFFVFFPNNYSGVNDDYDFATKYLTNGLGAGKSKSSRSATTVNYSIPYALAENGYGGYEMRPSKPISIVSVQTDNDPHIADTKVGTTNVSLYVQEGKSTNDWYKHKWYYRVDNSYVNQVITKDGYIDKFSFGLNSKNGLSKVIEEFGGGNSENIYSFADVYVALEGNNVKTVLNGLYDSQKVSSFLDKIKKHNVVKVECIGRASSQGHVSANATLQKNRARTIQNWLKSKQQFSKVEISATTGGTSGNKGIAAGQESSIANKLWRCTEVRIHLNKEESKTIQETIQEKYKVFNGEEPTDNSAQINVNGINRLRESYIKDYSENGYYANTLNQDEINGLKLKRLNEAINELEFNLKGSIEGNEVNLGRTFNAFANFVGFDDYNNGNVGSIRYVSSDGRYIKTDEPAIQVSGGTSNRKNSSTNKTVEYEKQTLANEADYFKALETEAPFLHQKISDKILYFDPAFHSISPEGFNERLTFLHQCTRQGPTASASDNSISRTANNLSFGRPPVCILRIGDFYYTKIIITAVNIEFEPLIWDLNPEGIGVMPMMADVTINFHFIGGSSLNGHINRLQNALSFNYYANTRVYDNRAELPEYDSLGNMTNLNTEISDTYEKKENQNNDTK